MFESVPIWMWIFGFLLVLGPLVTIHELGHYLVGRWFGVKAEKFSIGFGSELIGWDDKRGTRWRISAIPLGGYVQFKGDMDPASIPHPDELAKMSEAERSDCFQDKPLWQRALIVAAGPVTNLLVAVAIFAGFAMIYGKPVATDPAQENYIAAFVDESPAQEAGMQVGDRIIAIDGEPMADFRQVQQAIMLYPNKRIVVTVERDGDELVIPVTVGSHELKDNFGNVSTVGLIGIEGRPSERRFEPVGPVQAIGGAFSQCGEMVQMMITGIKQIIVGDRSVKELGGPIKIAKFSGEQLSLGPDAFVWFVALISLNLAFINFLPIPGLDGGHLAFYAVEAIRRKPVGPRATELAYRTGIGFVLVFMVFVTVNDVISLPIFGG